MNEHRLENRQGPLPFAALLVELRVDWSEAAAGLGFKTWSSATVPCFECTATGETMSCFALDPADQPYCDHTHADYLNEVMKCTVRVHVNSREMLSTLQDALWYDKRKKGSQGRALWRPVAGLPQLEIGDRLEVGFQAAAAATRAAPAAAAVAPEAIVATPLSGSVDIDVHM